MVSWAFEEGLRKIGDRDFFPLLSKAARRPPERRFELSESGAVIAAAECVAAAAGRPPAQPPQALLAWLSAHPEAPSVPLMAAAIKALDRIDDEPLPPDAALDDLRARLHGR